MKLKQKILKELKNQVYCRLRPSKIHGVGVFAIKDIPKGINPFENSLPCRWIKFSLKDLEKLNPEIVRYAKDMFVFEDGHYWLPSYGVNNINISYYLNHSKKPNMITKNGEDFITKRKIKVGEELVIDYGKYNDTEDVFKR